MKKFMEYALGGVIGICLMFVILFVIGETIDTISDYNEQHDRCLKDAANGLEIGKCN